MAGGTDSSEERVARLLSLGPPRDDLEETQALLALENRVLGRSRPLVRLSRYVLLERLGSGGAGVVHAAYDPELDRKVAIKLLRGGKWDGIGSNGEARLVREAQAMARLAHPNVIAVYDVGTYDENEIAALEASNRHKGTDERRRRGVFVVMELVEGMSLDQWTSVKERSWREILRVFVPAGRGLVAAHTRGLVHRDFKPSNVLVGTDGRVRVLDFGLARATGSTPNPRPDTGEDVEASPSVRLESPLTATGTVMGTPAYMAPEQHRGEAANPSADQFSYCVALFEALHRRRPFRGASIEALEREKHAGTIAEPSGEDGVPPWVEQAVRRGLVSKAEDRFANMQALLDALEDDPRVRRARRLRWGGGIAVLGLGGAAVIVAVQQQGDTCLGQELLLDGVWDDEIANRIEAAFLATEKPYAPQAWASSQQALTEYTSDWVRIRTETCRATMVEHDLPVAVMERRFHCLDQRLRGLGEITRMFAQADVAVVERAVQMSGTLPALDGCDDPALESVLEGAAKEQVLEIDAALQRANSLSMAAKYDEAQRSADAALAKARALGHRHSEARALLVLGLIQINTSADLGRAEDSLYEALAAAEEAGDADLGTRALIALTNLFAAHQARFDEAERVAQQAEGRLRRRDLEDDLLARFSYEVGSLRYSQARYDESLEAHQRALAIRERLFGRAAYNIAAGLNALGLSYQGQGQHDRALKEYQRALDMWDGLVGPGHPEVATTLANLGTTQAALGRSDDALESHTRALAIREAALPAGHPLFSNSYSSLGSLHQARGEFERALDYQHKAVEVAKAADPDHPNVGVALNNMANVLLSLERYDEALAQLEAARDLYDRAYREEHPSQGFPLVNMAAALRGLDRCDEAVRIAREAIALFERKLGRDHPALAPPLSLVAMCHLDRNELKPAAPPLARALSVRQRAGVEPATVARTQFLLARALRRSDVTHARSLAEEAHATLARLGEDGDLEEIETFLRKTNE